MIQILFDPILLRNQDYINKNSNYRKFILSNSNNNNNNNNDNNNNRKVFKEVNLDNSKLKRSGNKIKKFKKLNDSPIN